jgi:hypothetical protein
MTLSGRATEKQIIEAWASLPGLVLEVCRRLSYDLDVPIEPLLEGAATYLGFRSFTGFQSGMSVAARVATLVEWLVHEDSLAEGASEKEFLEQLARAWKTDYVTALENPPGSSEAVAGSYEDPPERIEALKAIAHHMAYELGELRESILLRFSTTEKVVCPEALNCVKGFASHLMRNASMGIRNTSAEWLGHCLASARFPDVWPGGLPAEAMADANALLQQELYSKNRTVQEVLTEMYCLNEGLVQVARMRRQLYGQPWPWPDKRANFAPPAYLLLGNAAEHAWLELAEKDGSYVLSGVAYVPNWSDIPAMLACSGHMPSSVGAISLAECQVKGMPPIAGWLRIAWRR